MAKLPPGAAHLHLDPLKSFFYWLNCFKRDKLVTFIGKRPENVRFNKFESLLEYEFIEEVLWSNICIVKRVNKVNHAFFLLFLEFRVLF